MTEKLSLVTLAYLAGVASPYVSFWIDWRLHRTRKYYE